MSVNSSQCVSLKTDLEITLPNGLRHYLLLVTHHFFNDRAPWKDPPSPPFFFLYSWRLRDFWRGKDRLLFQTDFPTFFKAHNWLRVGGFSKPHYLFSLMYNTHHRLHNVVHDVKAAFPEDNQLVCVCKQMQDSWWFVYLTSEWRPWPDRYFKLTSLDPTEHYAGMLLVEEAFFFLLLKLQEITTAGLPSPWL